MFAAFGRPARTGLPYPPELALVGEQGRGTLPDRAQGLDDGIGTASLSARYEPRPATAASGVVAVQAARMSTRFVIPAASCSGASDRSRDGLCAVVFACRSDTNYTSSCTSSPVPEGVDAGAAQCRIAPR